MRIEIELPDFEGYEYTGEHRYPLHDEWGCRGPNQDQVRNCNPLGALFILRKIVKEPSLLERIEEKWGDKEVVMLEWGSDSLKIGNWGHYHAQSMKGFVGYVYEVGDTLMDIITPTKILNQKALLPIAGLFTK